MIGREVDIELTDMADGLGVSLRTLMAGLQTDRFSEKVTGDDVVHSDKGDPMFFRVDQATAYSIFGTEVEDVATDMGTVEEMSREDSTEGTGTDGTATENPPPVQSGDPPSVSVGLKAGGQSLSTAEKDSKPPADRSNSTAPAERSGGNMSVQKRGGVPATKESDPPARDDRANPVTQFVGALGEAALTSTAIFGGAYLLGQLFSSNTRSSGLSGRAEDEIYLQGWNARMNGETQNPYLNDPHAAEAFKRGWLDAQERVERQKNAPVRVGVARNEQ